MRALPVKKNTGEGQATAVIPHCHTITLGSKNHCCHSMKVSLQSLTEESLRLPLRGVLVWVPYRLFASSMPDVTQASSGSASRERVMLNTAVASNNTRPCLHLQGSNKECASPYRAAIQWLLTQQQCRAVFRALPNWVATPTPTPP